MATIKSYTDLEQSKKLAEILPLESADMFYYEYTSHIDGTPKVGYKEGITEGIPCWSLSALLDILPNSTDIIKEEADSENERYMCTVGTKKGIISTFGNNPIDACYEMILKLN